MVEVVTGGASIGQGFETVIAQVAAEMIGVDYRHVRVIHGQTDRIAFGLGAHASRATVMTASATRVAALALRDKALDMAGQLMQAAPADLDIIDGAVLRRIDGAMTRPSGASTCRSAPSLRPLPLLPRHATAATPALPPRAGTMSSIKCIPMAAMSLW